jgi:hypothetical protein
MAAITMTLCRTEVGIYAPLQKSALHEQLCVLMPSEDPESHLTIANSLQSRVRYPIPEINESWVIMLMIACSIQIHYDAH